MATKVINSLTFGDTYVFTTPYGTSSTAAGTQAKTAAMTPNSNFSLETGVRIAIKFSAANSASSPTLNVNSTGAKTIQFRGAALTSSLYYWAANSVVEFMYDGTYWQMLGAPNNTNSTYTVNNATITLSASTGLSGGGAFTTNQRSAETISFSLATSGVTAGTYGPSADVTGLNGNTISVPQITVDTYGRVTSVVNRTYTSVNTDTNTNTYGRSGDTSSKIYLIGALEQSTSNKTTYSHDTAYVGTDGCLYSGGTKVLTAHQEVVNSAPTLAWGTTSTVGTVGGTALTVKLPSNPNTNTAHTHAAGTGISLTGSGGTSGTTTIGLANSGVTAGSYGPSAAASPAHSGTFSVPYITVDATGRITSATTQTITLPADSNTDTKVTQAAAITATTSANYPVMLGYSTATTAVTNTLNKSAKLLFNTGTGALTVGSGSSAGSGSLTVDGNIIAGGGSDGYGILPKTTNYSNLGYYNKYWFRAYVSTVYCNSIKTLSGGTFSFPATITWNTF